MNLHTLERIKQPWQRATDAMPQLICLVDRVGRVLHANRTLERWKLGEVEQVRGVSLLKERAELSGGNYEFKSARGQGTCIRVRWPAPQASKLARATGAAPLVQTAEMLSFPDQEMPDRFSACLACMRSLRSGL